MAADVLGYEDTVAYLRCHASKQDALEHLSALNLSVAHVDEMDTVVTLADRQVAFNRAVIEVLVNAGIVAKNEGWEAMNSEAV